MWAWRGLPLPLSALQVGIGGGMAEDAEHGDDLAFVVERVCDDVKQYEGGAAQRAEPAFRTFWQHGIQLCVPDHIEIRARSIPDPRFLREQCLDRRAVLFKPAGKRFFLQIAQPSFLYRQDMHELTPHGWKAKACEWLAEEMVWNLADVAQKDVQAFVCSSMQVRDSRLGEHVPPRTTVYSLAGTGAFHPSRNQH